jgi:O-antigen/teichoic acid export membrane protein
MGLRAKPLEQKFDMIWLSKIREANGGNLFGDLAGNRGRPGYANALYGIADYLALPLAMLVSAPFLLKHLGAAQYGVWILASAAVSSGGMVAGSFGDAVIKYVGECRGRRDWQGVKRIVRNMISINLALSGVLAVALWYFAPYVTRHVVKIDIALQSACLKSLRIGCGLLLVKSVEGVFVSTLRAFETYGPATCISIVSRAAMVLSAVLLTAKGHNVVWIMLATLFISALSMLAQALSLQKVTGSLSLFPSWDWETVSGIADFGTFSWVQAMSGVAFSYADRFIVGFFMGAPVVAYYSLWIQAAQPIHGLISSGMHFLFPHLSARYSIIPIGEIRRKVFRAIKVNMALVAVLSVPGIIFGNHLLSIWIGSSFDKQPGFLFPIVVCSFALLGMNVTAHYALLAVGKVRTITYLNLIAGIVMLGLMAILVPRFGLQGAVWARLIYGPITWLAYLQLYKIIWRTVPIARSSESALYPAIVTNLD